MSEKRVVITGMGTVNPLGKSIDETWHNLINGKSGVSRVNKFDVTNFTSQVAGQINDFKGESVFKNYKKVKRLDIFIEYAGWAF